MVKERVVVAMSGGVDSAVSALVLAQMGYEVIGITLRLWNEEREDAAPLNRGCCSLEDIEDARRVCQIIGAPHYVINAEREFQAFVVDYFVKEYQSGRTPHPCIACNDRIKFEFLLNRSQLMEADFLATGHYARIDKRNPEEILLLKGTDPSKDQSYVLFGLGQKQLRSLMFPVGEYPKDKIRTMAREAKLPLADKPDSQDICFIPKGNYQEFLNRYNESRPGQIVDIDGNVMGTHRGVEFFTIGQRRGIGINSNRQLYVTGLDAKSRTVVVGSESDLYSNSLRASGLNWTSDTAPVGPIDVSVKIRYKSEEAKATLYPGDDHVNVIFNEPQRAITPGQAIVFYKNTAVLGGAYIENVLPENSSCNPEQHNLNFVH